MAYRTVECHGTYHIVDCGNGDFFWECTEYGCEADAYFPTVEAARKDLMEFMGEDDVPADSDKERERRLYFQSLADSD